MHSQIQLVEALQTFFSDRGMRCRQHVRWWDEWSCKGPHGMRATFQPDRGRDRYVAEFTLVLREVGHATDHLELIDEFSDYMRTEFSNALVHAAEGR
jgi:hypothetical protein